MKTKLINILFNIEWKPEHHEEIKKTEHHEWPKKPEEFAETAQQHSKELSSNIKKYWKKAEKLWWDQKEYSKKMWKEIKNVTEKKVPGAKVESDPWNKPPVVIKTEDLSQLQLKLKEVKDLKEGQEQLNEFKRWILTEHLSADEIPGFKDYTKLKIQEERKLLEEQGLSQEEIEQRINKKYNELKAKYLKNLDPQQLNKIYQERLWELVVDKDWKQIPTEKYLKLKKEIPVLEDMEKIDPTLSRDVLALYWQDEIKAASLYLEQLKKDGKFPKNLEEFDKAMKDFQESIKEESMKDPERFVDKVNSLVHSWQISKEAGQQILKWLTPEQAHNVKSMPLPENFESLDWKNKTLALIKKFEWYSPKSFWDYKQYTRGYGTKAPGPNMTISESQASSQLERKIDSQYNLAKYLDQQTLNWLWDNQKAAMTSFIFNLWPWKLKNFKPLLQEFAQAEWEQKKQIAEQIANKMQQYNKAWWKVLKWLVARRKTEAELFMKIEDKQEIASNTENKDTKKA